MPQINDTLSGSQSFGSSNQVVILGAPYDIHSSFLRGAALAPARIRAALHSASANWSTEMGVDLSATLLWNDQGDMDLSYPADAFVLIENGIARGFNKSDCSLIVESNKKMIGALKFVNSDRYKGYRIFQMDI